MPGCSLLAQARLVDEPGLLVVVLGAVRVLLIRVKMKARRLYARCSGQVLIAMRGVDETVNENCGGQRLVILTLRCWLVATNIHRDRLQVLPDLHFS